jgi:hypothetical protein
MNKIIFLLFALLVLTGCADSVTFTQAAGMQDDLIKPDGFWFGLWNGLTFTFAWIGSLFSDEIAVYSVYNNGGWYDFGFWLGAAFFAGGASISSK